MGQIWSCTYQHNPRENGMFPGTSKQPDLESMLKILEMDCLPCRAEKDWHPGVRGVGCSGRFCPSGKRVVGFCCQLLTACLGLDISNSNQIKMYVQFSSVAQSCLTLCDPMGCSMPGLPVHHQLPEFSQTCVHWVGDAIQPSHPLLSPSPTFNLSQHQGLFKWVSSSHQVAKVLQFQLQHLSFQWIFRTDFL